MSQQPPPSPQAGSPAGPRTPDFVAMYKIVLVGDAGVGKTNMLGYYTSPPQERLTNAAGYVETFSKGRKPTVGVEFATKIVTNPKTGERIKAQIWDTAGQERYRAITNSHYRRAAGALLVFDVGQRSSFDNVSGWVICVAWWSPRMANNIE